MSKWIAPLILGLFGVIVLCGLGIWQLQRLEWKEGVIADLDARMQAEPMPIDAVEFEETAEELSGQAVSARGVFADQSFDILTGFEGGAGYRHVVVFDTNNLRIMVELGVLPAAARGVEFALPRDEIEIHGHLYVPEKNNGRYDATENLWVGYDLPKMAAQLDALPIVFVASNSPISELEDQPLTIDLPNNHLQYAITWFLLALAWAGMSIFWGISRNKGKN